METLSGNSVLESRPIKGSGAGKPAGVPTHRFQPARLMGFFSSGGRRFSDGVAESLKGRHGNCTGWTKAGRGVIALAAPVGASCQIRRHLADPRVQISSPSLNRLRVTQPHSGRYQGPNRAAREKTVVRRIADRPPVTGKPQGVALGWLTGAAKTG